MKQFLQLGASVLAFNLLCGFGGCGLPDVSADFWDERTTNVDEASVLERDSADSVVDLSTRPELKKSLDLLKDFDIAEIWLETPTIDPANQATAVSGRAQVSHDGVAWVDLGNYSGLQIAANQKIEIVPDPAMVALIKGWVKADGKFHVKYHLTLDKVPAKFTVKSRIHIVATAGL